MPSSVSTYTPTPDVTLDGDVPERMAGLLVSVTVEESVAGLARGEVRLDNWTSRAEGPGYFLVDRRTVDFGKRLQVRAGPPDERAVIFDGHITGIEADFAPDAGPTLVLLAEDALQDLRMTRRSRTFEESTDKDVIESVATDHQLRSEVDLDGPTHAAICQLNQSDLAFIRDRALPYGADVWTDGTTLFVGRREDDPIVLRHGKELLAFRVLADLALQATEQRVGGWDPEIKGAVVGTADQSALGADLGRDVGGGRLLSDAFQDRPAIATMHRAVSAEEADVIAKGLYRERARRFVTGSGVVDGIPGLRAGRSVTVTDLGAVFDGTYRLSRVLHRYDRAAGYRVEIEVERSGIGR
jgi:phage protein D